jgi:NADH-quinone oxidoreductase subunit M
VLGVSGAVLQMFSHGVIGALLFAVAGRMIYRRTHTRDLDALSDMGLSRALPFAAFSFVIASAASMGIPGFSGFAAEVTILIGAWKAYPLAVWITGTGMVLVAAFTLRALKKSFFGESSAAAPGGSAAPSGGAKQFSASPTLLTSSAERSIHPPENLGPITVAEKCGAWLLMFATLAVGLYPKLLLDRIMPAVEAMRFLK